MPVTQHDLDWIAARLLPDIYDINQRVKYDRVTRRLTNLYDEIMKFRITEDTFFDGQHRKVGDILDFPVGPYRNVLEGGNGLQRIPQFEELATVTETIPPPASFGEALASIPKAATPAATQAKSAASLLSQLAVRRNKLHDTIKGNIDAYGKRLADMETKAPDVFAKANTILDDESTGFKDLEDSLQEFAGANGAPLGG